MTRAVHERNKDQCLRVPPSSGVIRNHGVPGRNCSVRHLIEQAMGFFDIADFEPTGDGNVGGNHVTDIGLRSLQMGREKSESLVPFPTVALPGTHRNRVIVWKWKTKHSILAGATASGELRKQIRNCLL